MTSVEVLTWLYGASGIATAISYLPQIHSVWRSRQGAHDVSLPTWGFWCLTATVSLLYATVVVRDKGIVLMAVGNVLGCTGVAGVALWRRLQFMSQSGHEDLHAGNTSAR